MNVKSIFSRREADPVSKYGAAVTALERDLAAAVEAHDAERQREVAAAFDSLEAGDARRAAKLGQRVADLRAQSEALRLQLAEARTRLDRARAKQAAAEQEQRWTAACAHAEAMTASLRRLTAGLDEVAAAQRDFARARAALHAALPGTWSTQPGVWRNLQAHAERHLALRCSWFRSATVGVSDPDGEARRNVILEQHEQALALLFPTPNDAA